MICSAQNSQFIQKILQMRSKKVTQLLKSEDQMYVLRKKQEIIRNMPEILKPDTKDQYQSNNFAKTIYNSNLSGQKKGNEQKNKHFPSKFQQKSRNNMLISNSKQSILNSKQNFKNYLPKLINSPFVFETGIKGEFAAWKGQQLPKIIAKEAILQSKVQTMKLQEKEQINEREIKFDNQKEISFQKLQRQGEKLEKLQKFDENGLLDQQIFKQEQKSKSKIQNPFAPTMFSQSKNSPFISNKTNFLDLHTNKKTTVGNYMSPQVYSMNMLQYAQNKKRQNIFDDRYSYPNVIMGSSGNGWMKTAQQIRENPFQKTFVSGSKSFNQANYQSDLNLVKQSMKIEADNRFRQNVKETLKYTLEDRRYTATISERNNEGKMIDNYRASGFQGLIRKQVPQTQTQTKNKVLENPFVRRPASTYKY